MSTISQVINNQSGPYMKEVNLSPKRILVIAGTGPSLINFRFHLLEALVKKGLEVHAIGSDEDGVREKLSSIAVIFHPVNISRHSVSIISNLNYLFALFKLVKAIRPDICLSFTIKPVVYGAIAAALNRVRHRCVLITGLGYAFIATGLKALLINLIVRFLYKIACGFSERVIFQNDDDRKYFCQLKIVKKEKTAIVNGSGVDLSCFAPAPFPPKLTFLMIARFLPEKGIFEYVEACRRLKAQHPNMRCCLVGYLDSNLANITEETIELWKTYEIECLGKYKDVRPALRDCSVFVLPSYREGTPRTVLEAMAMSRPIITTDAPGCRQTVVEGKNGFLVPIKNSEALYQAMLKFVENPSLVATMGVESLSIAQEKFDVRKVNKEMCTLMQV